MQRDRIDSVMKPPGELRIGNVRLDFPVVQAALSGYSDMPMRLLARRMGAPYTLCEVMLDQFVLQLKPRRRIDDSAESREKFFEIFDGAFALGVAAITVHGRTVTQRYMGPSRWEFL